MRSVPHRVVCLLGLDDGVFPRHIERDGDDLIAADPQVGDNDARTEDRQLLLDALMAADRPPRRHLHGPGRAHQPRAAAGRSARRAARRGRPHSSAPPTGAARDARHRPPPPPALRRAQLHAGGAHRRPALELRPVNLDGARERRCAAPAHRRRSWPTPATASTPRPSSSTGSSASSATRCAPSSATASASSLRRPPATSTTRFPIELDALERVGVAERMLAARWPAPARACLAAERARGTLPPGELATRCSTRSARVEELSWPAARRAPRARLDRRQRRPAGRPTRRRHGRRRPRRRRPHGDLLPSRPEPRLAAWLRLLALSAASRTALRGADDRARPPGGSPKLRVTWPRSRRSPPTPEPPDSAPSATCSSGRPLPPGDAGAAPPLPQDLGGLGRGGPHRSRRPVAGQATEWKSD